MPKKKKLKIKVIRRPSILDLKNAGIKTKIDFIHTSTDGVEIDFDGEPTEQEKKLLEQFYNHGIVKITEIEVK